MPTSDTSEKGLEGLIADSFINEAHVELGDSIDYNKEYCLDAPKLLSFLQSSQRETFDNLGLGEDGPKRQQFLGRLQGEIAKRGIVDVLRNGIKHGPASVELYFGTPSLKNPEAKAMFESNIFSVTRQLRYSRDETRLALDLCLFINGLPIITFELKNSLTKQTVDDAVRQYKRDRDPREPLFRFGRCLVHFAVDDQEVEFCTELKGPESVFLPFNQGYNDGAGNPPNPNGLKTDYLWKRVLTKESLADIIDNYAQIIELKDEKGRVKVRRQIFPRYHQLDVVRKLLADAKATGVGKRYLVQHSGGSGKSNSISWLAHQFVGLEKDDMRIFDSVIVVTDRLVLDNQIKNTVKQFAQVSAIVGHAEHSGDLRKFLEDGKQIIITTVQKFPFIIDDIGKQHRKNKFAIIIDEAHESQSGKMAAKMNIALSEKGAMEDDETVEDAINRIIESRKMLPNASYFAFTATPKNKTLETFGEPVKQGGSVKRRPFHTYTMKQAIEEGFILDVLKNYTPVSSYYRLIKSIEGDPEFDTKKAEKKLRWYVETHKYAIYQKARIMIDHFQQHVIGLRKIGGEARAIVVTRGIRQAIDYFNAFNEYISEIKSPYKAIIAFSGEVEYGGKKLTEASLNCFPSIKITEKIQEDPYRYLIVAEKFQTGYDEPLLHTMYVDKALAGIKAVQTLCRLNRARPQKYDTFVLDFYNDSDVIQSAFSDYYRTTILSEETDPNKLHDLSDALERHQVYSQAQVEELFSLYFDGASRERLDPILDECVADYLLLDEDAQVDFKGKAKAYVRTYNFLASILPYNNPGWERLATFLNFLIPKLPAPKEDDMSQGILQSIDLESYRAEVKASMALHPVDKETAEIGPVPTSGGGHIPVPQMDKLSNIIKEFNQLFGNIRWKDTDKIHKVITEEIPAKVAADRKYQNAMKHSDKENARIELEAALQRVMNDVFSDHAELYKQFVDNPQFKKWLSEVTFDVTYKGKDEG